MQKMKTSTSRFDEFQPIKRKTWKPINMVSLTNLFYWKRVPGCFEMSRSLKIICQRDPRYIRMCLDAPPYRWKRDSPIKDHLPSNWIANCINWTQDRPHSAMIWMAREGNKLLLLRKHHNPTELSYDSILTQMAIYFWLELRGKCRQYIPHV
jgi:hypothetical protein